MAFAFYVTRSWGVSLVVAAGLGGAALLGGCPGTLDDKEKFQTGGPGACPTDIPAFLAEKCGTPGCHSSTDMTSMLDLQTPGVESRISGAPASAMCPGVLADPMNPEQSILYEKLLDPPPCGSRMPLGSPLTDEEIECIGAWIGTLQGGPTTSSGGGMGGGGGAGGGMGGAGGAAGGMGGAGGV